MEERAPRTKVMREGGRCQACSGGSVPGTACPVQQAIDIGENRKAGVMMAEALAANVRVKNVPEAPEPNGIEPMLPWNKECFMCSEERKSVRWRRVGSRIRVALAALCLVLVAAGCSNGADDTVADGNGPVQPGRRDNAPPTGKESSPQRADDGAGTAATVETASSLPALRVDPNAPTVGEDYPRLATAGLVHARLAELSGGVLLRVGDAVITQKDIDAEIAEAPQELRAQLRKNAFFLLEQMATQRLVLQEARQAVAAPPGDEGDLIQSYLKSLVEGAEVSGEEVAKFHRENQDLVGEATLQEAREQIRQYVLQQKQQEIIERHLRTLARRMPVAVSAGWVEEQAELARDNPVDRARASGKPTFANFGAEGCVPCDMMEPIREALREEHEGKLNVVFVHVGNDKILAARYGVQGIPMLCFFDAEGNEVSRHTGYLPREKIEERLAEVGVK